MKQQPEFLEAKVGEYRPAGCSWVRITAAGCVIEWDIKMLEKAQPVEGNIWVRWANQIKPKTFTRLLIGKNTYLADRVTGTLYNEQTGLSSSYDMRLVI